MDWMGATLTRYPELAVFLVVGVGYWIGAFKIRGFGLGPVTGSLLVGLILGSLVAIPVSSTAKSILFLLFLFGIGYSVGPKFFDAMKGGGLRWVLLAVVIAGSGLVTAYAVTRVLGLDAGYAAGMVSGALTESPAIGTATEAINALPLPEAERNRLIGHVAVADAICYVFGAMGVILFCSVIGPRLLRLDLKAEAIRVEKELGIDRARPGVASAWRAFEWRAYRIAADGRAAGQSVAQLESAVPSARVFVERIRRGSLMLEPSADLRLEAGDVVAVAARRDVLTDVIGRASAEEVEDREVLDVPIATYDVFVTSTAVAGRTLADIARSDMSLRSVFLHSIRRGGQDIPVAPGTIIERADIVRLTGPEPAVVRAAGEIGKTVLPSDTTDFVALGLGIVAGALLGAVVVIPLGVLRIPLGTSVGTLLMGLVVGYLHSRRPLFARIPEGAISFMNALGLAAFVAMIGLGAGPHFIDALREAGVGLFLGGMVVTTVPLMVGLYFGRYVLRLDPLLLLGGIAGALTMTAGMAGVQERSGSPVAVLGYSGTVAVGHILLTTWGTVIVHMVS
ncbi:MAG TPA: aspartate-alanine antiporter [Casimicrobiaceae bacterium]|nr:aspartate-alanine antiporter [Casimicrobiaceae bacterium]